MPNRYKDTKAAYLFLTPSLLGVGSFVLLPFADVVRRSFYEAMSGKFVGLDNYYNVLHNNSFLQAITNTLRFLLVCIPLLLVVSLVIALLVFSLCKTREWFKTIFLMPMAIPVASVVLLWNLVFDKMGYLNELLAVFHLAPQDWMNEDSAFGVLVFSYIWKNTGYNMVLWMAGLNAIPDSIYEAAKVDGAGCISRFRYITLPGLKPAVFVIGVLSFVNSFKVFREVYLIAGDYPHGSIYMLQHLFNNWFISLDIQKMSAAAVMISICIITFILIVQRRNERGGDDWNG